jgi:hypothetical protein
MPTSQNTRYTKTWHGQGEPQHFQVTVGNKGAACHVEAHIQCWPQGGVVVLVRDGATPDAKPTEVARFTQSGGHDVPLQSGVYSWLAVGFERAPILHLAIHEVPVTENNGLGFGQPKGTPPHPSLQPVTR